MAPKASGSKAKTRKRADSDDEYGSKAPKKKATKGQKKGVPDCLVGEELTAIETNHFVDMPYRSSLVFFFENSDEPFKVDTKAGPDTTVKKSLVANTFDYEGKGGDGKKDWFQILLTQNEPPGSDDITLMPGAISKNCVKYTFKEPLTVATANMVATERGLVKPGVAKRGDGATKEVQCMILTFEGMEEGQSVHFEATKAAYSNPYDEDPDGFEEYIIPVDLVCKKTKL